MGKQICLTIVWGYAEMLPPVVESVGIHICQICNQRLNFLHISIIFKSATSIKHRNFNFSIYLPLVKINRPFGFVDSWMKNTPLKQLGFFFPSFWRTKTATVFATEDSAMTYTEKQQNFHIMIIFQIHNLMGNWSTETIPLITKEVWIVSEAILKTHASCWPGSPETSKDARIFDTFEFLRNLEKRTSFSETSKDARVFQKPRKTHEFFRNLKRRTSFSETLKNARDFDTLLESHYKRRGQKFLSLIEKNSLVRLSPFWIL